MTKDEMCCGGLDGKKRLKLVAGQTKSIKVKKVFLRSKKYTIVIFDTKSLAD